MRKHDELESAYRQLLRTVHADQAAGRRPSGASIDGAARAYAVWRLARTQESSSTTRAADVLDLREQAIRVVALRKAHVLASENEISKAQRAVLEDRSDLRAPRYLEAAFDQREEELELLRTAERRMLEDEQLLAAAANAPPPSPGEIAEAQRERRRCSRLLQAAKRDGDVMKATTRRLALGHANADLRRLRQANDTARRGAHIRPTLPRRAASAAKRPRARARRSSSTSSSSSSGDPDPGDDEPPGAASPRGDWEPDQNEGPPA